MEHIFKRVENNGEHMDNLVNEVVSKYTKDLDNYVKFVRDCLCDGTQPPTDEELTDFCLNLATYIYFSSTAVETVGIRDDISKAVWKETYNKHRDGLTSGTVADKNSKAEMMAQEEELVNNVYHRAYAIMKAKVNAAQELLSSCKKVLSHRMQMAELTRIGG